MSEFFFGGGRGRVRAAAAAQIDEIARRHDCRFIFARLPGEGPRYWFAGPNRGHPFDDAMARAVWADLVEAGLAGPGPAKGHDLVESCFVDETDE